MRGLARRVAGSDVLGRRVRGRAGGSARRACGRTPAACASRHDDVLSLIHILRKKKEKVLCTADFLVGELELSGAVATFSLESQPTGSLRPDVLLRACCEAADAVAPEASAPLRVLSVMRTEQRAAR